MQLWKEEKDVHIQDRLWALWQLRLGRKMYEVASGLGVCYRTLRRWINWYRKGGLEAVKTHRQGQGGGRPPFLTLEQQSQLREESRQGNFRRIQDSIEWAKERWGIKYS